LCAPCSFHSSFPHPTNLGPSSFKEKQRRRAGGDLMSCPRPSRAPWPGARGRRVTVSARPSVQDPPAIIFARTFHHPPQAYASFAWKTLQRHVRKATHGCTVYRVRRPRIAIERGRSSYGHVPCAYVSGFLQDFSSSFETRIKLIFATEPTVSTLSVCSGSSNAVRCSPPILICSSY